MKNIVQKFFTITCQFLMILGLFLYSFTSVSSFSNLSANEDCGSHYIEICSAHNDSHLVLNHHQQGLMSGYADEIPHDSSHQIQIDNPDYLIASKTLTNDLYTKQAVVNNHRLHLSVKYYSNIPYTSFSPPDSDLIAIKTIRLQI